MNELTFKKLAVSVLKETKIPMTVEEIWEYAIESKRNLSKFQGATPWRTIGAQIYLEIKSKGDSSDFKKVQVRPVKFGLNNMKYDDTKDEAIINTEPSDEKVKESELHKFLTTFADFQFNAYTKTISEKNSKKGTKGQYEWLHPDIVGVYSPKDEWTVDVFELHGKTENLAVKLYSFELKLELNFTKLREYFFQTVSNSYWANEAYLVAAKINKDPDFYDELKRLSSLFGIGIIELDISEPQNSTIIFPAAYRMQVDWETINLLCNINTDFESFISSVLLVLDKKMKRENLLPSFNKISKIKE